MKEHFKLATHLLSVLAVLPLILLDIALRTIARVDAFDSFSQLLSLLPGKNGSYLRVAFYRAAMAKCSPNAFIGFGTLFAQRDTIIGSGSYIGPQCNIGSCVIGKNSLIASGVHIMSGTAQHRFDDLNTPIRDQGGSFEQVKIGDDCWIGNGALIMADVGDGCVVGAGSVVTTSLPALSIAVGNPARIVRSREDSSPLNKAIETTAAAIESSRAE